jgi:hypothetical protein
MINPFKEVNWKPDAAEKRKFAKSLMIGFPVIAALILIGRAVFAHAWHPQFPLTLGGIGFAAGLVFWLIPAIATPFFYVWYAIACCVGIVIGNVLLGGFYFTFVTGLRFFLEIIGKPPILKRPDKSAKSYWLDAEKVTDVQRYFRQF